MESVTMNRKQRGATMIETMAVLALGALLLAGLVGWLTWRASEQRNELAAEHGTAVLDAAKTYIRANFQNLYNQAAGGPVTVPASSLYLGQGVQQFNAYAQVPELRVVRDGTGLDGMVFYRGGQQISKGNLISIANSMGFVGGYVAADDPANAVGMMQQWKRPVAAYGGSPGTGVVAVAVFADMAAQGGAYLHRNATPGKPELNRMSTGIDMDGNNISGAGTVAGNRIEAGGVEISEGGMATAALSIGKASFGALPYPYETIQVAPGMNFRVASGTQELMSFGGRDVNFWGDVKSSMSVRAQGVMVNDAYASGSFHATGSGGVYWDQWGGGWYMGDPWWIRATNDKNIYTGGEMQAGLVRSNGQMVANGRATFNEFVQINGGAAEGTGCSPNGLVGRDGSGKLLSCTDGVWRSSGGISTFVVTGAASTCVGPTGSSFAYCPDGSTLISGGSMWLRSCRPQNEQYRFTTMDRPVGNAWEARIEESSAMAYAICAR